jgi:hypothetical protein
MSGLAWSPWTIPHILAKTDCGRHQVLISPAVSKIRRRFFDFAFCVFLSAIGRKIDEMKQKETPP